VLVVEDEPAVRTALAELLEQWHYRVEQASNGDEALARVAQSAPQVDLIVSDVVMPKMGGIDLVRALRKNGLSTPVILLSGYVAPGDREQIKGLGIEAWLDKPPDADLLAKAVARALGGPNKANSSEG
jgi:CheY-like chemotaxis protein